jgi:hypothetical protein
MTVWYAGPFIPDSHPYRITSTKCRIGTVFSPDDGHIVDRNMKIKEINKPRKIPHKVGSFYNTYSGVFSGHLHGPAV